VAFTFRFMQSDFAGAREVSELALERSASDPSCRCEAHHAMGGLLSCLGELDASRDHFEAALAAYDERHPQRSALGSDLGVFAHAWGSHSLWLLGDENAALDHIERAIALARRLDHTYSLTLAYAYAALLHQMRGDLARVREAADAAVTLSERYEFGYYGDWARVLIGWAHGHERPSEGIAIIETALAQLDAQRAQARRPYFLSLLAEICNVNGDRKRAESILDSSIAMALERGDRWWLPAMYLQKSDLQTAPQRDATLRLALETARSQRSRGLEHRILAAAPAERGR
jgi:predicted ATPase